MIRTKIGIVIILHSLVIGISCQKEQPINMFTFSTMRPSSYLASDGNIRLITNNANLINSIEWTKPESNFKSYDININNLTSGLYNYKIFTDKGIYYNSIFLASLDTIEPLEYFPAYPGSKWIYTNNDTIWCSDKYNKVPLYPDNLYGSSSSAPIDSIYVVNVHGVSCFYDNNNTPDKENKGSLQIYGGVNLFYA